MKIHYDIEQGTQEWLEIRAGRVTASELNKILTPVKLDSSSSNTAKMYTRKKIAESILKKPFHTPQTYHMARGHVDEPIAREIYRDNFLEKKDTLKEVGFISNEISGVPVGYSPDGIIGSDGLIEIKSRLPHLQLDFIQTRIIPPEHYLQIQGGLYFSGRKYCDYVSYSNGMPLIVKRITPEDRVFDAIYEALLNFKSMCTQIQKEYSYSLSLSHFKWVNTEWIEPLDDEEISL